MSEDFKQPDSFRAPFKERNLERPGEDRISTGSAGLDDILGGGLPAGHLYLLEGDPGTGKTTLALQFLLEGTSRGERGIYVTLSESKLELEQVAGSHGWSTDSFTIYEMMTEEDLSPDSQYTVFHPSEVELADTITEILKHVEELQPQRIIFDSLSELRMLAQDPLRYRRQILALKRYFAGRNTTVLLLDDRTAEGGSNDLQLQSIAHGVIKLQSLERDFGVKRRRLEVHKLRGSAFREGYHDYTIETGGISVYPRLIAAEHHAGFTRKPVPSGLQELDDLLRGGVDSGTSTLMIGPAGCGKSTIALRFAITSAERGDKAVIFTFDENLATLSERATGLHKAVDKLRAGGMLEIHQIDPAELSPGELVSRIQRLVNEQNLKLLIIDSLNGILNAMPHEQFLSLQLHELLSYLGQQGVATFLTVAQHGFFGVTESPIDVSYLADTVILIRYFERAGEVRQAISVVKKRSGPHERTLRELIFEEGEVRVGPVLKDFDGVLTGTPRYTG